MANETTERRSYPRLQFPSNKLVSLQGIGLTANYRCKDVGLGGMLIECSTPLTIGSMVRFAVQIGGDAIRGVAAIRRASLKEMGLGYTSLTMDDRAKLR